MSSSPSVNPRLAPEQKRELATRYGSGERLAALTAEYGVWTATAKWAIRRARVPLRPEDQIPNVCRVCRTPVRSATRRFLCAAHVRLFCSRCEAPLPEGRANRWCTACEAAHKGRLWEKAERVCTTCGKPATQHACQCADCQRADYELQRQATRRTSRACADCQKRMPAGRRSVRCTDCYRQHEQQRRKRRHAEGRHRCVMCGEKLPLSRASYCAGCDTMIANWRRAYHDGDAFAKRLGRVERRRQWQARERNG